jgi:hypothetical protein
MTNTNIEVQDALSQIEAINAIVDNYNSHKTEKNKELTPKEVRIIAVVDTPHYEEFLLTTGRNDGLLYSLQVERLSKKVSLYLYNRIAKKILNEGIQREAFYVEIPTEGEAE